MGRILFLAILIGVGLLASSLPSGATATTLDTASLGTPDLSTPVVPVQPDEDDDDDDGNKNKDADGDGVVSTDDLFLIVAKKHPEFGGMFVNFEKDTIYVFLLDGGDLDAVVKELKRVFPEGNLPQSKAKALEAKYSFLQLREWFDPLTGHVSNIPEVTLTDIDDSKNRLTVGVENRDAKDQVIEQVEEAGIPVGAVNIVKIGPPQFDQQLPPDVQDVPCFATSLNDHCRPLVGGLQIGGCTLGVTAISSAREAGEVDEGEGFVTASHCSNTMGAPDGTIFYQPTSGVPESQIGVERLDSDFLPNCPFEPFDPNISCSRSDGNFSEIEEAADANVIATIRLGHIARPVDNNGNDVVNTEEDGGFACDTDPRTGAAPLNPSLCCDTSPQFCAWDGESTFPIATEHHSVVGMNITKVGMRTGRTEGIVVLVGGRFEITDPPSGAEAGDWMIDQTFATYPNERGDSGAPVFWGDVNVALLGINSGFTDIEEDVIEGVIGRDLAGAGEMVSTSRYSPIANVEFELGPPFTLNTCVPPTQC